MTVSAGTISLSELITQEANAQGVPPSIALGVAQTESGIAQWTPNGNVVTSPVGALGVFQLMPATAAGLGVDPTDVNGNIKGGITYLKQLFDKYGDWNTALAAYNWGPGNVDTKPSIPSSVTGYVNSVLTAAGNFASDIFSSSPAPADTTDLATVDSTDTGSPAVGPVVVTAGVIAAALAIWYLLPD